MSGFRQIPSFRAQQKCKTPNIVAESRNLRAVPVGWTGYESAFTKAAVRSRIFSTNA